MAIWRQKFIVNAIALNGTRISKNWNKERNMTVIIN